jgi:hypothetical protein
MPKETVHQEAQELMNEELDRFADELEECKAYVRKALFGVEDATRTADEDQLAGVMDSALFAGHDQSARAVATVSAQRGRGDLLSSFVDEVEGGAEARSLYAEWTEVQDLLRERLERRRVQFRIPPF